MKFSVVVNDPVSFPVSQVDCIQMTNLQGNRDVPVHALWVGKQMRDSLGNVWFFQQQKYEKLNYIIRNDRDTPPNSVIIYPL